MWKSVKRAGGAAGGGFAVILAGHHEQGVGVRLMWATPSNLWGLAPPAQDGLADLLRICYPRAMMNPINDDSFRQINQLVDEYRDRCLWFLRADYYPTDRQDALRALDYIRRYGDREAFRKAGELYQWLLLNSNRPSANS